MKRWPRLPGMYVGGDPNRIWSFVIQTNWDADLDAAPRSGDSVVVDGMEYLFECVDVRTYVPKPRQKFSSSGRQMRHYAMHRIPRRRDSLTVPVARVARAVRCWWYNVEEWGKGPTPAVAVGNFVD